MKPLIKTIVGVVAGGTFVFAIALTVVMTLLWLTPNILY